MLTYRIDVTGTEDGLGTIFGYSVHGNVGDMSLNLRFTKNFSHGYSADDAADIIKWLGSRKWLTVLEIRLVPMVFSS